MLNIEKVEMYLYKGIEMFKWESIKIEDVLPLSEITKENYLINIKIIVNGVDFRKSKLFTSRSTPEDEKEFHKLYNMWKDYEQG